MQLSQRHSGLFITASIVIAVALGIAGCRGHKTNPKELAHVRYINAYDDPVKINSDHRDLIKTIEYGGSCGYKDIKPGLYHIDVVSRIFDQSLHASDIHLKPGTVYTLLGCRENRQYKLMTINEGKWLPRDKSKARIKFISCVSDMYKVNIALNSVVASDPLFGHIKEDEINPGDYRIKVVDDNGNTLSELADTIKLDNDRDYTIAVFGRKNQNNLSIKVFQDGL